jgi:hypothetical protein
MTKTTLLYGSRFFFFKDMRKSDVISTLPTTVLKISPRVFLDLMAVHMPFAQAMARILRVKVKLFFPIEVCFLLALISRPQCIELTICSPVGICRPLMLRLWPALQRENSILTICGISIG